VRNCGTLSMKVGAAGHCVFLCKRDLTGETEKRRFALVMVRWPGLS
jgi:hypothetical protein